MRCALKTLTVPLYFLSFFIMETLTREVMIGMLRKGNTGNDILSILNVISPDQTQTQTQTDVVIEPTLEEIAF